MHFHVESNCQSTHLGSLVTWFTLLLTITCVRKVVRISNGAPKVASSDGPQNVH